MSDDTNTTPNPEEQLQKLRDEATALGIQFHHATGAKRLSEMIAEKKGEGSNANAGNKPAEKPASDPNKKADKTVELTPEQHKARARVFKKKEATKLVRCRITCMNPNKKAWPGEIISVSNKLIGTVRKYVPFNQEPYHLPDVILKNLRDRKCQIFLQTKLPGGRTGQQAKLINEFNIEILPPLTKEELKELAKQQAMSGSTSGE